MESCRVIIAKRKAETSPQQWPCKRAFHVSREKCCRSEEVLRADFTAVGDRLCPLAEDDQEFLAVKSQFLGAVGLLAKHARVVGIRRCTFETPPTQARRDSFLMQELAVEAARGNANVRFAWHGTSRNGVSGIVVHGFGQPGVPKNGARYGSGVYLAPETKANLSAIYADVDEAGAQHVLLCKVIMGKMEQVPEGSKQFYPSSEDYDTGVDDLENPSRYIVWSTHMNTHILPLFAVSFKLAPYLRYLLMSSGKSRDGLSRVYCPHCQGASTTQCRRNFLVSEKDTHIGAAAKEELDKNGVGNMDPCKPPKSPWISFPELLSVMQNILSPSLMVAMQHLHSEFQAGRLPRISFVRVIRAIAGDAVLQKCIMGKTIGSHSETCGHGD